MRKWNVLAGVITLASAVTSLAYVEWNQIGTTGKATSCIEVEVGDSQIIDHTYPWGISAGYILARNSDNHYEARVNIDFEDSDGGTTEYFKEQWRDYAQQCLQLLDDGLSNIMHDRQLVIRLTTDSSAPVHHVRISGVTRSSSTEWSNQIGCGTLAHEVFHLLGLADEYEETSSGFGYTDHGLTYVAENAEYPEYNCRHPSDSEYSIMSSGDTNYQYWGDSNPPIQKVHLSLITSPGCMSQNSVYYDCSQNAYMTSQPVEGFNEGCHHSPDYCSDPTWILMDPGGGGSYVL